MAEKIFIPASPTPVRSRHALPSYGLVLLFALLPPIARADVTVSNSTVTVSTPSVRASFQGMNIQSLTNLLTNEQNISQPGPGWMDISMQQPTNEPLQSKGWQLQNDPSTGAQQGVLTANDSVRTANVTMGTDPDTGEIVLRFQANSNTPGLRSIFFGMQGFDPKAGRFLIPAHAGVYFDRNTNPSTLEMEYPTHWEAQFVIYETAQGGILIYAKDPRPYFKRIQASRVYGTLDLGLEVFALGPWSTATDTPPVEWRIRAFQGSWQTAVDAYRSWSKTVWAQRDPDSRRDWVKQVKTVITIIDPVVDYVDQLAKMLDPTKTLLYLANWRNDSFDVNYPDYTPGPNTAPFIQRAHQLGFHVMLHTNALGVATYNSAYASVSQYQLRDPDSGNLIYWPQGLWPAGSPPPFFIQSFAFISPCSSQYRAMFIQALQPAIDALQPDAVHLDAGGVMLDDGNGLIEGMTSIEGMIQLHKDVAAAFPQLAFSYESMTEVLASFEDYAQRWNADYPAHPISTYLMGDHVTFYGFLDQPPVDQPGFIDYIKRYEDQGIMPTIPVNSLGDLTNPAPITSDVLNMMNLWQQFGFQPDWQGDWTGLGFRYISADGSTSATLSDTGRSVTLTAAGQTVYQRVYDTSTAQTPPFVSNWEAFDGTALYGLDPTAQYWVSNDFSPSSSIHLGNLPSNVSLGAGTLATPQYGYFELNAIQPSAFDFISGFSSAKAGTDYLKKDYPIGDGDLVEITRTSVAGRVESPVILMQPPTRLLGAAVFLDYSIQVPTGASVQVTFSAGISDFETGSDGATFVVRINGADAWSQNIHPGQLVPGTVDLTPWVGQTIHLRFIVHPGPHLNPIGDLGCWANLAMNVQFDNQPVPFDVVVPASSSPAISGSGQFTASAAGTDNPGQTPLPAKFAVFANPPQSITKGQSLLDLPFDVWKTNYGGMPFSFKVGASGSVQPVISGGQTENKALATFPPQNGLTLVTWAVQLPPDASTLNFKYALADPLPPLPSTVTYSQTAFSVEVNGTSVWSNTIQLNGWNVQSVDVSPWAGQNVIIQIAVDALGQGTFNWSDWAGLTVN
jgi:hypothetical protein